MENKNLKKIIDDELSNLVVTESLKQQTLDRIHSPKKQIFRNFFNVKLSLVSSLIVVFIMGLNLVLPGDNEKLSTNSLRIPNVENAVPDSFDSSVKSTTTTATSSDEDIENNKKG
ncbi:MAG: hypothetical protein K0Q49_262 [Haloplasmataceae bacterium]|jgi:hypothetical protein|nr:hypothetical protein [Haloplasmataceae bacterium]